MINYEDRFDGIENLPVSEEMLGAYIEGALDPAEEIYVSEYIDSDPYLSSLSREAELNYSQEDSFGFPAEEFDNLDDEWIVDLYTGEDERGYGLSDSGMEDGFAGYGGNYPASGYPYDGGSVGEGALGEDVFDSGSDAYHYNDMESDTSDFEPDAESTEHHHDDPFAGDCLL